MAKKTPQHIDQETCLKDITDAVKKISDVAVELKSIDKTVKEAKNSARRPTAVVDTIVRCETRNKILKGVIDSQARIIDVNFKKLAKVLPDKRSTELTDPEGNNPFATLGEVLKAALEK